MSTNSESKFACMMREWPGFENTKGVYDHISRFLPRDPPIFRRMRPGDEYPEAHRIAVEMFETQLAKEMKRIRHLPPSKISELRAAIVPPYPTDTFPNRWWKLVADAPSRTLMAHIGKDTYSHIHYDSRQSRVVSVREAARLQSFPDGFKFAGGMNAAFTQIGNAVPPLLAFSLAKKMVQAVQSAVAAMAPIRVAAE
jgi:DNA (cytosine-5)-methyltransferase 1